MYKRNLRLHLLLLAVFLFLAFTACQPGGETSGNDLPSPTNPLVEGSPSGAPQITSVESEVTRDAIQSLWESSLHANTYVVNEAGMNSTCARCHAPINYVPSMDDMPETCAACKFEVEPPPPTIAEADWQHIPCSTCHRVKKDVVQPEYAWLSIPPIDEYEDLATTTELCLKCHINVDVVDHDGIELAGAHADYACTECHDAHSITASCATEECHTDVLDASVAIAGHDADHNLVTCWACHDAAGLAVGPNDEGKWITLRPETLTPFVSHNTVKDASCERCHFADNPWNLSAEVPKVAP